MLNSSLKTTIFLFLVFEGLASFLNAEKVGPKNSKVTTDGMSQQDCAQTWANLAIRSKFWSISNPEKYYCRNSGNMAYECGNCWIKQQGKPSNHTPLTLAPEASSCTIDRTSDRKGISIPKAPCLAYHLEQSSGRMSCLSQAFTVLQCHAGHPDPSYLGTVCDQCTPFQAKSGDRGTIFEDGSDFS
ncbi:secreted protein [Melampsora americana]|nr:secreted protein [Melampsora americana]